MGKAWLEVLATVKEWLAQDLELVLLEQQQALELEWLAAKDIVKGCLDKVLINQFSNNLLQWDKQLDQTSKASHLEWAQ